jgi:hypothetical protein
MLEINFVGVKIEILNEVVAWVHNLFEQTSTVERHILMILICCCHAT